MDLEEGNSPFCYWEKSIAHCKSHDFTFLPFTFLPFYLASISELCKYKWVSYEYPKLHI